MRCGTWVPQLVEGLILDFSSGHDPKLCMGLCAGRGAEAASDSQSLSLCPSPLRACTLSLKQTNKQINKTSNEKTQPHT